MDKRNLFYAYSVEYKSHSNLAVKSEKHLQKTAGIKCRSQVTGQVTGHRSQVTMKNTCKFAASSYLVGICLFRPFLT